MTETTTQLAISGGPPVREGFLPYGRQTIDEEDIAAVVEVLRSDWLTTGPKVEEFERLLAGVTGAKHAVAVSNGTAALHAAMAAIGIGPGDEVIVPAITFVATANSVVYQGGTPVFADVQPDILLIDPADVARRITPRTRAIVAVDYAGQPCDYDALRTLAASRGLKLLSDACHALGGSFGTRPVGSLSDLSTFSFHPVKPITTGEGGAITTDDSALAEKMRIFRSHGIASDFRHREKLGAWAYEMTSLGFNYRLPDLACALGIVQLRKLPAMHARRSAIAALYDAALQENPRIQPLALRPGRTHGHHLYVVKLDASLDRDAVFRALRAERIGVNVHYAPVHLHPFYRERFGHAPGLCPVAEREFQRLLSLPIFPRMTDDDARDVLAALDKVVSAISA